MSFHIYPPDAGSFANQSESEKKQRLDAMVKLWQLDTERACQRQDRAEFISAVGLSEYRYAVSLRFPEWARSLVVGQVLTLRSQPDSDQSAPLISTTWRHDPLLATMPDWKLQLPMETVLNLAVLITPGGLGEGSKWAVMMPKEMRQRYRAGWPTQAEWVAWTHAFDWLSLGVGFIRSLLDSLS